LFAKMFVFGSVAALACLPIAAQSTESDISARLVDKVLYLRGRWSDNDLTFDADGKPSKAYKPAAFTEAGFEAKSVNLRDGRLRIEGQRMALEFAPDGKMKQVQLKTKNYSGQITIEVKGNPSGSDFGKALDAIFAPDLASLVPSLPNYWQSYAQKNFLPADITAPKPPAKDSNAAPGGGTVKPPKLLKYADADFTQEAKDLKFSGTVQIYMWIEENGAVSHFKIVKPLGLGLDEAALVALQKYKFAPATRDGKPVKVDMYIDVKFQVS
jgi:TonB family protein